jgi:hypothetical protein
MAAPTAGEEESIERETPVPAQVAASLYTERRENY